MRRRDHLQSTEDEVDNHGPSSTWRCFYRASSSIPDATTVHYQPLVRGQEYDSRGDHTVVTSDVFRDLPCLAHKQRRGWEYTTACGGCVSLDLVLVNDELSR
jgi:hypothetical protein